MHLGRARPPGTIINSPDHEPDDTGSDCDSAGRDQPREPSDPGDSGDSGESAVPGAFRRPPDVAGGIELCVDAPDPVTDPSVLRYTPSDTLAALVRDRDSHCRFPGCTVPADGCDLDHVIPYDHDHPERGGWTVRGNLGCLCRHHHRAKTTRVWTVHMDPDTSVQHWTGPTGQQQTTQPDGLPPSRGEHGPPIPAGDRPETQPPRPRDTSTWGPLWAPLNHMITNHTDLHDHEQHRRQWHDHDHPPPPRPETDPTPLAEDEDPPPF